jgi:two-component system sensor histidine kinase CreC
MNIAIRLFIGYFLITGLAAWFVVNIFAKEVEPGVRHATEDALIDTANLLAELAAMELSTGQISHGRFAAAVDVAIRRDPGAEISGVSKKNIDLRVYLTDARGIVVYDSAQRDLGADYSQWRDVARVLSGQYGARSTRDNPDDPATSVMYVAAPILAPQGLIGVLTVAKPGAVLMPYAQRAQDRVYRASFILLAASALIGLVFTFWLTASLNRLRNYAHAVANGEKAAPPVLGGRQLSELGRALALMRERLDGKQYVESYVQSLTHEMKSPLSAVRAAAELLQEDPPGEDRQRFLKNILDQSGRMQRIVERLLVLARVEHLQAPESDQIIVLGDLVQQVLDECSSKLEAKGLRVEFIGAKNATVRGDSFLLQQAIANLVDNAIDFSPIHASVTVEISLAPECCIVSIRDHGPGAPDFALEHLFTRFYSLPRPGTEQKCTGLGLAFVREVARLHGGEANFSNAAGGGALASLKLAR